MHETGLGDLVLREGEILLRPSKSSDRALLRQWLSDPLIYKWWGGTPASDTHVVEHCGVQRDSDGVCWPLIIMKDEEPAGYIQAWKSEEDGGIDLFIEPAKRRQGIATRAATLLATHLHDVCGWRRVIADPDPQNLDAVAMWLKAGFALEKTTGLYVFDRFF